MPLNKDELIRYRIERCNETIIETEEAIRNNHFHLAVNRIYYAIFYAISALAIKDDFSTSKHHQLLGWFNKQYVSTNIISKDLGKIYRDAFTNRMLGDYDDFIEFEEAKIRNNFNKAKSFINEIKALL